ncbi:LemA family protein [Luedemannella helvata]|uniref:LemA family protein n=1 Tax=Luedemannella helvata TaxID=349315 RepID=A0ABP4XBV7_9ACTN
MEIVLLLGAVVVIIAVVAFVVIAYNRLVGRRNAYQQAFAQIDVQLTRRHDLVPNLVETAKGYLRHERETLERVTAARSAAVNAQAAAGGTAADAAALGALAGAENQLTAALGRLFGLAEAYPDLKANQNMLALTEELTTTENRVAFARQAYNDAVMAYNIARETVPTNIIAGLFSFGPAALFELADPGERQAPRVEF